MAKFEDPNQYNAIDLYAAFLPFLRKYLKSKGKVFSKNVPLTIVINEIQQELASDYEITDVTRRYGDSTMSIIHALVNKGVIKLPSLRPKQKFTKKFGRIIQKLFLSKIKKIDGYSFKILEPQPYEIMLWDEYDFGKLLKSDLTSEDIDKYLELSEKFRDFLSKKIKTIEAGHPALGEIDIYSKRKFINPDDDNLLKKVKMDLNQIIRENGLRDKIPRSSVSIITPSKGPKLNIRLSGYRWGREVEGQIILNALEKLGYNRNFISIGYL
jgi:hypothetical protein